MPKAVYSLVSITVLFITPLNDDGSDVIVTVVAFLNRVEKYGCFLHVVVTVLNSIVRGFSGINVDADLTFNTLSHLPPVEYAGVYSIPHITEFVVVFKCKSQFK